MWYPRPSQMRDTARAIRRINDGGGPRRVRLVRVGRPKGLFLPSTEATVEVETVSGNVVRLSPELPVPFLYAWAYRFARRLGLPLASTLDPEDLEVEIPVPRWISAGVARR
jgi:hypothetical protein